MYYRAHFKNEMGHRHGINPETLEPGGTVEIWVSPSDNSIIQKYNTGACRISRLPVVHADPSVGYFLFEGVGPKSIDEILNPPIEKPKAKKAPKKDKEPVKEDE